MGRGSHDQSVLMTVRSAVFLSVALAVILGSCAPNDNGSSELASQQSSADSPSVGGASDDFLRASVAAACMLSRGFHVDVTSVYDPPAGSEFEAWQEALYGDPLAGSPLDSWELQQYVELAREIDDGVFSDSIPCADHAEVAVAAASGAFDAAAGPVDLEITDEMASANAEIEDAWELCASERGFEQLRNGQDARDALYAEIDRMRTVRGVDVSEIDKAVHPLPGVVPRELTETERQYLVDVEDLQTRYDKLIHECDTEVWPLIAAARERFGIEAPGTESPPVASAPG